MDGQQQTDDGEISNTISSADETFGLSGANKVWRAGIPEFSCPEGLVESFARPKAQPEDLLRLH